METTLPRLPTELVELTARFLEPTDLASLRLACKELNCKSLRLFGALFTTIRTDLSRKSFQKLEAISEKDALRLAVHQLLIKQADGEQLGEGFECRRHPSGHLKSPLPGFKKLQHLLAHKLPNCRSFHIYSPRFDNDPTMTPSDVISLILRIIPAISVVASESLPVKSFIVESDYRSIDTPRLRLQQYRRPPFRNAWAHLQELVLVQTLAPETFDWMMDLILNVTSLRKLSLDFDLSRESSQFLEQLCGVTSLHRLESLKLATASTSLDNLSKLIERSHDTLRILSLHVIKIHHVNEWPILLGRLWNQAPLLKEISLYYLMAYYDEDDVNTKVIFNSPSTDLVVPQSGGRSLKLLNTDYGVEFQGPGVNNALDMIVKAVKYVPRHSM